METTLGGDRLGSGKKQKVYMHGYERSTHDMSYVWRSTMAAGTLVPFMCEVALPADSFDIDLQCDVKTHPTIGPLFGSYKVQLDLFECPIRLYQALLHNNALNIGLNMASVKLPQITLGATRDTDVPLEDNVDYDNTQVNPSCLFSYLGIRGIGFNSTNAVVDRDFNAVPFIAYWDIYKNYYANKQEEIGAVIHSIPTPIEFEISVMEMVNQVNWIDFSIPQNIGSAVGALVNNTAELEVTVGLTEVPDGSRIIINTSQGLWSANDIWMNMVEIGTGLGTYKFTGVRSNVPVMEINFWRYATPADNIGTIPQVTTFPLSNLDDMRNNILANILTPTAFSVNSQDYAPYNLITAETEGYYAKMQTQEGLALKTYQSDLFNNWIKTEWIDGAGGITDVTAINVADSGYLYLDTLNLAQKVYNMLNRIALSGGTYNDWVTTVYDNQQFMAVETPMYHGGLSKELVFQEVISNALANDGTGSQPLGTLAGRGVLSKKHKGGQSLIKIKEPGYIIGIVSITPRIDYSQGNKWDTSLKTMDDFHKPALDEIGFQELIQEQMAWWTTEWVTDTWVTKSAGKVPAWINYMTNVNQVRGNFAVRDNEMFMTLNRRYEKGANGNIADLTTYIDPVKFNNVFAETSLDAQNFWVQIGVGLTVRRKMSAKVIPNL